MANEKVLVVGAGGISDVWFRAIQAEEVEVIGVVDLDPVRAASQIAKYGLTCRPFTKLKAGLRQGKPDFVLNLTVPEAHCAVTCTALSAGYPVIGEKPMASSMAEARKMVRAAEKSGKLFMVSQSRRWNEQHVRLRAAIRAGQIGAVTIVNCDFFLAAHFGGFRDQMPSPLILDMSIHHFDLARYLTGADPVQVYAREFNPKGSWYKGDVAASCIFEMTNGVVFNYRGSWCAEGCHTDWNGDWRVCGEQGTLLYQGGADPRGERVVGGEGFHRDLAPVDVPAAGKVYFEFHGALREMLEYLRTGKMPQTECHDNIQSLAMVFAAIESSRKGKCVPVRAL